jgi:hypothetical protein
MGYKREHVPEHAAHFRGWADFSRRLQEESGRPITIGIGAYFNAPDAVITQCREAQARGLGTSLFSFHRPSGDARDTGLTGSSSPMWARLGQEIYPTPAPPLRPTWRQGLGTVAGHLRDAEGSVMDTAPVNLVGVERETKSDGTGFFAFLNLEPGVYQLSAPGAPADGREVTVRPGEVTWVSR